MTSIDKKFYSTVFTISMPIALQNIISFSVNLMDTVMLGTIGEIALSASSLANQMFFIFNVVCFGVASGATVLASQYWGKRDTESIQKIIGLAVKITIAFAIVFTALVATFPTQVMRIFTPDAAVIEAGARYLRMVSFSYLFGGVSATILMILRSVETVKISLFIYSVSFCINVFFNYMFIFGKFGAPELGVTGAAVGTVIARFSECVILLIYLMFFEKKIHFKLRTFLSHDKLLMRDMMHFGLPVMVNEFFWAIGVSMHSVILGHISASVVAANSICNVVYQIATSFIFGIASASAVITGNIIGTGDIPYLRGCVKKLKRIYFLLGLASAALLVALKNPILSIYSIEPETRGFACLKMDYPLKTLFCLLRLRGTNWIRSVTR